MHRYWQKYFRSMRQKNALCAALKCAIDLGELLSRKRHRIKPLVKRKLLSFGITIQLLISTNLVLRSYYGNSILIF